MSDWFPAPSVAEERAHALHGDTRWRYNGTLLSIVFSVLAALAVMAAFGLFHLLRIPRGVLSATLAIATAEWLIRKYRFFGTGLESSLWLCGLFAFIFGLPSKGKVEALLVFAAAAAMAGWRMRSAFCGALAAVLIVAYIAAKWDSLALTASVAALIAIAATLALRQIWQRPSTERLFAGLALVIPVAGYVATLVQRIFKSGKFPTSVPVAIVLAATAVVLLIAGIAWRDRILLISGTLCCALAAIELRDVIAAPAEAKLIAAGAIVVIIAISISRALRNATRGFVVTPVRAAAYDEAIQIAGIISLAPHGHAPPQDSGPDLADSTSPTDKSFGGAGAGGGF